MTINPLQYVHDKTYLHLKIISWGLRVGSFCLLTSIGIYVGFDTPFQQIMKLSGITGAGLMAIGARITASSTERQGEYRMVTEEALLEGYTQHLMHSLKPQDVTPEGYAQQIMESLQPREPLQFPETKDENIATLNDVGKQTHVMVIGETGAGKSTLATEIANRLGGMILVIDPHAAPNNWQGLEVVGKERNYAAIAAVLKAQLEEMNHRYSLRAKGEPYGYELTTIVDEGAAIAQSIECKKIFPQWFSTLGCEARKVKMRMIILSQGQSAKTLNIEGQTEMRSNFSIVRLGKFAIKYAKTLKESALIEWLGRQERPAMLDDRPLLIPDFPGNFEPNKRVILPEETPPIAASSDLHTVQKLEALLQLDCGEENEPILTKVEPRQCFDPLDSEITPELREQVLSLDDQGYSQSKVILQVWQTKSSGSKKYKAARQKYRRILAEANRLLKGKKWGEDPDDQ